MIHVYYPSSHIDILLKCLSPLYHRYFVRSVIQFREVTRAPRRGSTHACGRFTIERSAHFLFVHVALIIAKRIFDNNTRLIFRFLGQWQLWLLLGVFQKHIRIKRKGRIPPWHWSLTCVFPDPLAPIPSHLVNQFCEERQR